MRLGNPQPPLPRWSCLNEAATSRACCAQPVSPVRSAGHGDGPGRRRALRPLRTAAAPMRQLPRRGRTFRPLLRFLRPRDGARREPPDVVEAVASGSAGAAGSGPYLRNSPGRLAPGEIRMRGNRDRADRLTVQALAALHAEAVPAQVVVTA